MFCAFGAEFFYEVTKKVKKMNGCASGRGSDGGPADCAGALRDVLST